MDFPKGHSTFYDFPETQACGFIPTEPPETNPPGTTIPSTKPNFNFEANMESSQPWLVVDVIAVPGAQHPLPKHTKRRLPKFDLDNDVLLEDHIKQFMFSLRLMDVEHEDIVCRLFPYTFVGKTSIWFVSHATRSITSWKQFETSFMT